MNDVSVSNPVAERGAAPNADLQVHGAGLLLAYGGLALPLWLSAVPHLTYLPAFYAQELHLSAGLVGFVFFAARLWDVFANPIVGWLSDRSVSKWGRRKPWVLVGTPFLMVSTWFMCSPSEGSGVAYLVIWAVVFYTAWAAMYVPYLSWGTELASDYAQRSWVTSFREPFTMLSNLFLVTAPLVFLSEGAPLREVLQLLALTVLIIIPVAVVALAWKVPDPPPAHRVKGKLVEELVEVSRDRVMRLFVLATLCFYLGDGVVNSLLVFYFQVGVELPNKLFVAIFILYIATISAVPLMLRVARHVEKHRLLAGAVAVQVLAYTAFALAPAGNFAYIVAVEIMLGISNSAMLALPTSILADIVDHGEANSGERRSGAYVAVFNLALKLGMTLGVGLAFGLLQVLGFEPGAAQHGAADANHIRLVGFALPALLQIPVIILYFKHPISRAVQRQLREQIEFRQSASGAH